MDRVLPVLVAIAVSLALPVGQLRWIVVERACCCPDPDRCQCPHDEPPSEARLGPCHATAQSVVSPQPAAIAVPTTVATIEPVRAIAHAIHLTTEPHAPPPPRRPDAPS